MSLMKLQIWPSDFLLPSVDALSLQFLACSRMCAAPLQIVKEGLNWRDYFRGSVSLPVFRHGNQSFTAVDEFVSYLRKQIPELTLDGHLDRTRLGISQAYKALLEEKLLPAYTYCLWLDNANCNVITSRWYGQQMPVGLGLIYIRSARKKAEALLKAIYPGDLVTNEDLEYITTKRAFECLRALSAMLGSQKFFFGDKPSSLDALAFGYLAVLLKTPFPNDKLQKEIRNYPNLVRLVDSMISIYMPLTDEELTEQKAKLVLWEDSRNKAQNEIFEPQAPPKSYPADDEDEFPLRDKIYFGVAAGVVTLLFCLHFGIISVKMEREPSRIVGDALD